ITGGTVYPVTGAPIPNGTVLIRDGKIAAVGAGIAVPAGAIRIDATGKWLTEVSQVDETNDFRLNQSGPDGDQVAAAFNVSDGINPRSMVIPVTRIAG